jgi:hypothetical protein
MRSAKPTHRRWRRVAPPAVLAALAVLFWRLRIIAPADQIMFGASDDPYTQIYPMVYRAAEWLRHGTLPLWNPYQYAGHPFLATVLYGIFYPPNVLFFLLRPENAIEASSVLHLFLAGVFTYAYLREVALGELAAFAGALTFTLSGFFASQALWFLPAWGAAVWLPLALLAIERLFATGTLVWSCVLALCVAMPIFAGWLQTWVYSMYGIGAYLAFRTLTQLTRPGMRADAVRAGMLGAVAVAVGLGLAAVQLLPSFELQSLGPRRPGGLTVIQSLGMGGIPPQRLLNGAVNPLPGFPRPTYVGVLWLLLAPVTLLAARRLQVWFFWLLAVFAVLVALTIYTPFFGVYRLLLPAATWFRFPDRILFLYAFSCAVLLAFAIDALARSDGRSRRALVACLLASGAGAAWVFLVRPPRLALAYMAAGLLLLWSRQLVVSVRMRTLLLTGLVLVQGTDLFFATRSPALHPYHDTAVYDAEHEVLDTVKATQGFGRTYIHFPSTRDPGLMPKQGSLREIYTISDYEPLSLQRVARFYRSIEGKPDDPDAPPFIGLLNANPTPYGLRLLDLLSVRFIVVGRMAEPYRRALELAGWTPGFVPRSGSTMLYTNPKALPRAFVVPRTERADSENAAFTMVTAAGFDPRRAVVLEATIPSDEAMPADGGDGPAFPGATIADYEPTRVVVEVAADRPGWLVLTDTYYPGWVAEVDGTPAAIERANYLFRAVRVPGKSRVVFTYRPRSIRVGATISLLALAILITGLVVGRRWSRRPGPSVPVAETP